MKAASEIYSPVSGTVTDKNEEVENGPALINQSPLEDGWMFKWVQIDVKICQNILYNKMTIPTRCTLSNPDDVKSLMTSAEYETYLKECEE